MKTVEEYRNRIKELKDMAIKTDSIKERDKLESQIDALAEECADKIDFEKIPMPCKFPTVKVTCNIETKIEVEDIDFFAILEDYLRGYISDLQEEVNKRAEDYEIEVTNDRLERTLIFE